ncbi:MAG: TraR/DksA C4-type zinc finger protein [Gemmatimonadales bacterium]|nr:TraR/DksA C4-type zinc finger protein [Gemmatimonadota bacterium]MCL4215274.1 TraR/DksA C4-type zinc finger protein [Gemmatimonadales bacterium]
MTTRTQATHFPPDRSDAFRASADAPLSRSQLTDLAIELRREITRLERSLASDGSSPELDSYRRALRRIDEGTYGVCIACGGEISFDRLQVMPATQWCVRCAR